MKAFIYCGVPGSGKTSLVESRHPAALVCSADHFFMVDGRYRFDASKIGEAHSLCLRRFVAALSSREPEIVADNTNTTIAELAPYAALAQAYGYELRIVTVLCDPVIAHARNRHGVPLYVVQAMHERLMGRELPPWWPAEVHEPDLFRPKPGD